MLTRQVGPKAVRAWARRLAFALALPLALGPWSLAAGQGVSSRAPSTSPSAAAGERTAFAEDIREAVESIPVAVDDANGRRLQANILVTTYRPPGDGPFPLAVISHGRTAESRQRDQRQRLEAAARFFVRKGFAVAVPTRVGYGMAADAGDPEAAGPCERPRHAAAIQAAAHQIDAVVQHLRQAGDIELDRLVLMGHSVGGLATVFAAAELLHGDVVAINLAGGHGGHPDLRPGEPCGLPALDALMTTLGTHAAEHGSPPPTLWLFAANDRYFSAAHQRRWAESYRRAGGQVTVMPLPAHAQDGHEVFTEGNDLWQPAVDDFLRPLGYPVPGALLFSTDEREASPDLTDLAALPQPSLALQDGYRRFLAAPLPRAFATDGQGRWHFAVGDDAPSRALALCDRGTRRSERCRLYAVNRTLVWSRHEP